MVGWVILGIYLAVLAVTFIALAIRKGRAV